MIDGHNLTEFEIAKSAKTLHRPIAKVISTYLKTRHAKRLYVRQMAALMAYTDNINNTA